jgi:MoxR-like ATPase
MLGRPLLQFCMTAETEPSHLEGSISPKTLSWTPGVVTQAVEKGSWLLLDNVSDAEAPTLERLNPLLERIPTWTVPARGSTAPSMVASTFRFFATMSEPYGSPTELSPALYNRFAIIYLNDIEQEVIVDSTHTAPTARPRGKGSEKLARTSTEQLKLADSIPRASAELVSVAESILGTPSPLSRDRVVKITEAFLRSAHVVQGTEVHLTLRTWVRFWQLAVHLYSSASLSTFPDISPGSARNPPLDIVLCTAVTSVVLQGLPATSLDRVSDLFATAVGAPDAATLQNTFVDAAKQMLDSHGAEFVLDEEKMPDRYRVANFVALAVGSQFPVLLEGKPAVGKTRYAEGSTLYVVRNI